jgi:hypothetical protein
MNEGGEVQVPPSVGARSGLNWLLGITKCILVSFSFFFFFFCPLCIVLIICPALACIA